MWEYVEIRLSRILNHGSNGSQNSNAQNIYSFSVFNYSGTKQYEHFWVI